jgi:hypothetical protein
MLGPTVSTVRGIFASKGSQYRSTVRESFCGCLSRGQCWRASFCQAIQGVSDERAQRVCDMQLCHRIDFRGRNTVVA